MGTQKKTSWEMQKHVYQEIEEPKKPFPGGVKSSGTILVDTQFEKTYGFSPHMPALKRVWEVQYPLVDLRAQIRMKSSHLM